MASKHQQLPEEILHPSTRRKIFLSLLAPWILFCLANFATNLYLSYFPNNYGYWIIKKKWEILLNLEKQVDFLILGDSSCNQGVVPQIVELELNTTAINLCTTANSLVLNNAWMLSKYIEKYGTPKNVLIVHVYDIWHRNINWNITSQTPLFWRYWNKLEPNINVDLKNQKTIFVNQYVPLYSQNTSIQNIIHNPDLWFSKKIEKPLLKDGFMVVTDANSREVEIDTQRHIDFVTDKKFRMSKPNQKSLEAIVKLAEKHDFKVYLANSPIYEKLWSNQNFKTYYSQLQQELQEFSNRSEQIHYIIDKPMTFSKQEMNNADHLIASAAKLHTQQLVSKLKKLGI